MQRLMKFRRQIRKLCGKPQIHAQYSATVLAFIFLKSCLKHL